MNNNQILSDSNEKNSVKFDLSKLDLSYQNENLKSIIDDTMIKEIDLPNIVDIGIQTDSDWIEELKKELIASLQNETTIPDKISKKSKQKASTIRSQATRPSGTKSKKNTGSILAEDLERGSIISSDTTTSLPVYPERRIDDEFGVNLDSSSDDDGENFDFDKLNEIADENFDSFKKPSNDEEIQKAIKKRMIFDAGLPTTLKVSKELGSENLEPPMSVDAFLAKAMIPATGETCDFCKRPLIPIPSIHEQVESNMDQAKLFCCQEFRDLVDFALAHQKKTTKSVVGNKEKPKLIDISPHKSHKSPEELAEDKAKSERKIRERLLERQNAALLAAQTVKMTIDGPRRAYTEMPIVIARQMKVINYQLSSFKFMEDGWTMRPPTISNDEISAKEEMKDFNSNMDYSNLLHDIFGQIGLSNRCSIIGVIRQYYPDGRLFMILFPTGSASIYYPSGNLAISIIREALHAPMICVIQDDSLISDGKSQILGIVNTNGFGSFSFNSGDIKILFDTLTGIEMKHDGSRKRQWYWDGKPHTHAPPFQPLFLSINRFIGIRISSQQGIYINYFSITRQIRINAGFRSDIPERVQQKMHMMVKIQTDKLTKPLNDIKNRIHMCIEKCHEALGHPNMLLENKWPMKPFTLSKITTERKTTLSLSIQ